MSPSEQPGLRLRLAHEVRRIAAQHEYLSQLERRTRRALEHGDRAAIREALDGYREALDAHFDLEEQVHFPALHGLRSALAADLGALTSDHGRFRTEVGRIAELATRGSLDGQRPAVVAAFRGLSVELREHEAREERLLRAAVEG